MPLMHALTTSILLLLPHSWHPPQLHSDGVGWQGSPSFTGGVFLWPTPPLSEDPNYA